MHNLFKSMKEKHVCNIKNWNRKPNYISTILCHTPVYKKKKTLHDGQ